MENKWVRPHNNGVILTIKVVPNSSRNKIAFHSGEIKLNITAPAIENRANQEIIKYLSKLLKVKKSSFEIVSGDKSKQKQILIMDAIEENIKTKINEVAL